ncbi:hypothetical protein LMH73_001650 [Vibrio splendidus]|uniref:hypothetical protein n=1 Tax=Vibrio splendidus TaxID=29497 RepID=UPI000C850E19|nr:hypothetical protein [Vibrio splendidus]MCC4881593.1 hypothetical protein [Vibrio splendidus]PMO24548.1 hypothetical protein BCT15_05880 [Vibrio splendidus]
MSLIEQFLSNPIVAFIGYAFSLVAACIAIVQTIGKSKAKEELKVTKIELINITEKNNVLLSQINQNKVEQGEKSQYFQDNNGSVTIDNRN